MHQQHQSSRMRFASNNRGKKALDAVRNWRSSDSGPKETAEPVSIQQAGERFWPMRRLGN